MLEGNASNEVREDATVDLNCQVLSYQNNNNNKWNTVEGGLSPKSKPITKVGSLLVFQQNTTGKSYQNYEFGTTISP